MKNKIEVIQNICSRCRYGNVCNENCEEYMILIPLNILGQYGFFRKIN